MDCPFCQNNQIAKRIIIEDNYAFAFLSNIPIVIGHALICPKRHVKYYEEMSEQEKNSLEKIRMNLKKALKKTFNAEGFNYAWNEEKIGGQSVPHFHLHLLPRKQGDQGIYEYEPRKFLYRSGDRPNSTPDQELEEIAKLIHQNI